MALQTVTLDVDKLYKQVEGLVLFAANKYCAEGHPILNKEDLIGAGWEVFARVLNKNSEVSEIVFLKLFKTSLFNQMVTLIDKYRFSQKRGWNGDGEQRNYEERYIDLSEVAEVVGREQVLDIYYNEYVEHVTAILKEYPDAKMLFQELIDPSAETYVQAINETMRRQHLQQNGILVRGVSIVRVRKHHVQKVLGWTSVRFAAALDAVKESVLNVVNQDGRQFAV